MLPPKHRDGAVVTITQRFDNSQKWNIAIVVPGEDPEYHPPLKARLNPYAPIIDQVLKLAIEFAEKQQLPFDIDAMRVRFITTSEDFVHQRYEKVMCEMGREMELEYELMKRNGGPKHQICPETAEAIKAELVGDLVSRRPFLF